MCALRNRPHDSTVLINPMSHMSALIVRRHDSNVRHHDSHVRHHDSHVRHHDSYAAYVMPHLERFESENNA